MMPATPALTDVREFLGVFRDDQTHRNVLYLLLAMPLGFIYYTLLAFGFVLGITLSVLLVGIPILLATILLARLFTNVERRLTNSLLGTNIDPPEDLPSLSDDGIRATVAALLHSEFTWRGIGFLVLKSFVGFTTWLFVLVAGFTALGLLLSPLGGTATVFEIWTIDTLPERLLAVPLGLAILVVGIHVLNAIAGVTRTMALSLLATDSDSTGDADETGSDADSGANADDTDVSSGP